MSAFVHRSPPSRVVASAGALDTIADELAALGIRRPILVSSPRAGASRAFARLTDRTRGLECAHLVDVPAHSSQHTVEALRDLALEHRADGFVAFGGGSVSDTAKAAAMWLAEGGALADHASRFTPPASLTVPELRAPKLPIVAIPLTASAAEVTPSFGVRTDDGRKLLFTDPALAARLIILDAHTNLEVPAPLMIATGMNGLAHCVEALYSRVRTPITDALALHGIRLFENALPAVADAPESIDARAALLAAAHLSGCVLLNARTCLHHAICHALGAVTGVGHGDANSVVLPYALRFNAVAAGDLLPTDLTERVETLRARIGAPRRLRDLGLARTVLPRVADKVMGERGLYFNPRPIAGADEVESLLEQAW